MWLSVGLSVAVCVLWLFAYNRVFDMTFDESYARASGVNTTLFNTLAAVVVAVVIVISMRLEMFTVGSPDQSFTIPRLVDASISDCSVRR